MMDDLISRAAAIKEIEDLMQYYRQIGAECDRDGALFARERIKKLPAVDAVPVVRCSECKYAHMTYDGECKYCDFWQEDGGDALYLDKGFYCAAGERRDGET